MSWTTPTDITSRWISKEVLPEDAKLQTFIEDVEAQINYNLPAINDRIAANEITVPYIVSRIATIIIEFLGGGGAVETELQAYTHIATRQISFNPNARKNLTLTEADLNHFKDRMTGDTFDISMAPDGRASSNDYAPAYQGYFQPTGWTWQMG